MKYKNFYLSVQFTYSSITNYLIRNTINVIRYIFSIKTYYEIKIIIFCSTY